MEETIKDLYERLNKLIIQKIISGEFTAKEESSHTATILVDGYEFTFWMSHGWRNIESEGLFVAKNLVDLTMTDDEKKKIYEALLPTVEDKKKKRIEELKAELARLEA
mgnify:CR=1 FL=1